MFASRKYVKDLEDRIAKLERKQDCSEGKHAWVVQWFPGKNTPYIGCAYCYALPPKQGLTS